MEPAGFESGIVFLPHDMSRISNPNPEQRSLNLWKGKTLTGGFFRTGLLHSVGSWGDKHYLSSIVVFVIRVNIVRAQLRRTQSDIFPTNLKLHITVINIIIVFIICIFIHLLIVSAVFSSYKLLSVFITNIFDQLFDCFVCRNLNL